MIITCNHNNIGFTLSLKELEMTLKMVAVLAIKIIVTGKSSWRNNIIRELKCSIREKQLVM